MKEIKEIEEMKVLSAKGDLEELKKSIPWTDIKNELEVWKEGFEREMASIVNDAASTNPSTASVLLHMGDINGRIRAVDYMLQLPDMLIDILEGQKQDQTKTEEE